MGGIRKFSDKYIPISGPANRSQRSTAKEAILWLLDQRPHSAVQISEHFGLEIEVVNQLVGELLQAGRIQWAKNKDTLLVRDTLGRWWEGSTKGR